ncbi:hypothetical protein BDY19DRAFT_939859 [Irpex rosettiformis]|uniref:Uncharacterized protein n=1 Tax=Irpex rosettiformis TaxID=378272 RepID=A0ACB8U800_9APHY|nr:hypothetical protein BDY19DRAFT_939859 [Irpex rosettiformis]
MISISHRAYLITSNGIIYHGNKYSLISVEILSRRITRRSSKQTLLTVSKSVGHTSENVWPRQ